MWHAWMRNAHASTHPTPIFRDTRSVQLVPEATRRDVVTLMHEFSPRAADALIFMAVIRFRLLADRLPEANARGVRQLVILGAGLDTTVYSLSDWAQAWRVFEVDHPATQDPRSPSAAVLGVHRNAASSACDGVIHPRVCRGRPLSSAATASRSAWV